MKKLYIFTMILLVVAIPLFFAGCVDDDNEKKTQSSTKIQLDLANAKWDYNDDFEFDRESLDFTEYEVKVVGLPSEISVWYDGITHNSMPNNYWEVYPNSGREEYYTATVHLDYDEEKYELINDNLPRTLNWKIYDTLYLKKEETIISRPSSIWYDRYSRSTVNYIHFVEGIPDEIYGNPIYEPNYLWSESDDNGDFHLYFGLDTSIYKNFKLPKDSSYLFSYFYNLKGITGLDLVDFSKAEDLSNLFHSLGITSDAEKIEIILPDNLNLKNAKDMQQMFSNLGNDNDLVVDLGDNFDTSNVTNMFGMFASCGKHSKSFSLDLGDKFYTSKVTNMEQMFANCGNGSEDFYLDLGKHFDISNTASLRQFLLGCGSASQNTVDWHLEFVGKISKTCDLEWIFASFLKDVTLVVHDIDTFELLNAMNYDYPALSLV